MNHALLTNLDKIHTTELGVGRIRKNLGLEDTEDVVRWCKQQIINPETLTRAGKNWNVRGDGFVIVINAHSYTIITAHKEKKKKGNSMADVGIIKKPDDIPELKEKLIQVFHTKTHRNVSRYSLLLADHILKLAGIPMNEALAACYLVNQRWQKGEAKFQEARDAAGVVLALAREEKDPVKAKALRVMGQVAATPHVKRHALIASDYAVKMINLLHPGDWEEVRRERECQIMLMESV